MPKKIRQAANYAINKEAIVNDVLEGTAAIVAGPTPPADFAMGISSLQPYPYDPAKAKLGLTEGGSGMLDPVNGNSNTS